ncbi:hypothetical protein Tco_1156400 [Tanacetum coccineum]
MILSKKTRFQTKDHNDSLIAQMDKKYIENADLKAQIQEKAKPDHVIASSKSRISSKNMPRFSSNDMVHHYLEEAKKKTQEKYRNSKSSVMHSTRLQNTTNGSKPKPRINNQTTRSFPVSKSSCVTSNVVPLTMPLNDRVGKSIRSFVRRIIQMEKIKLFQSCSAATTPDASDKRQQQLDPTSSTSTLATTITADGNFDLYKCQYCSLILAECDSLPHAYAQAFKVADGKRLLMEVANVLRYFYRLMMEVADVLRYFIGSRNVHRCGCAMQTAEYALELEEVTNEALELMKIQRIRVCTHQKTTKETSSIRRIQRSSIRRIEDIDILIRASRLKKVMADKGNKSSMETFAPNDRAYYYSGITSIKVNGKNAYELKGKFLDDLHNNAFSGTNGKDAVEHIEYYLKIIDPIKLPNVDHDRLRIVVFPISLAGGGDEIEVSDDESSDLEEYWSDNEETVKIFKIETDVLTTRCLSVWHSKNLIIFSNWREDGYCNGGNFLGAYHIGNSLHYQDLKWYEALEDSERKDEALRNKAIMKGLISDDESSNDYWKRWKSHEIYYHNYDEGEYKNETHEEGHELCGTKTREVPVCQIKRYNMLKYSFNDEEEYVAVKEDEYDDLTITSEEACRAYQEIFWMMDEGWMVTHTI